MRVVSVLASYYSGLKYCYYDDDDDYEDHDGEDDDGDDNDNDHEDDVQVCRGSCVCIYIWT